MSNDKSLSIDMIHEMMEIIQNEGSGEPTHITFPRNLGKSLLEKLIKPEKTIQIIGVKL